MAAPSKQALKVYLIAGVVSRRSMLAQSLADSLETVLVGQSEDALAVVDLIQSANVDAIILEVGSSRVDACILVRRLIQAAGTQVIVVSETAALGSHFSLSLFEAGALDVLPAPPEANAARRSLTDRLADSLRHTNLILQNTRLERRTAPAKTSAKSTTGRVSEVDSRPHSVRSNGSMIPKPASSIDTTRFNPRQVIVLGASTGGTEAIRDVLTVLPAEMPGICIVQHIPAMFSRSFAQRLNTLCALEVREAEHGDIVRPGLVLVAPGGYHMEIQWEKSRYAIRLHQGPEEHHQRPAVDVLFRSAAKAGGQHVLGVLLTGMGKDGALGMKAIKEAGGINLAQDDKSSVVFGMPAAAQELGVVHQVLSLKDMAGGIQQRTRSARMAIPA